ncbi:monocarboxylate transporter 5-like [Condylostylus longicornis]|uniref:monocarboxylate transporter 5-like n=1 Tax=Condylostylus longicornis TaxID=2530218 RepID=UPI00244DE7AE|nr:monocarboxylate transporter 5-like [Condylostylus longicornis]
MLKSKNMEKKKRRNKSDYGDDFIAPDGGWGWLVSIAAGIAYVTVIGFVQIFGLLFRDRMQEIGLENSQITAIGNTQVALSSCIGLFNGPLFRRFTYRQIGIMGSVLSTTGIFLTSFASSFISFFVPYSILFGFGMGFVISAATIALNTYFKIKRPVASSIAWAIAGLGPVCLPMVIAVILPLYGYTGTMLLFTLFTLHNLPSALVYQPVLWHVKKIPSQQFILNKEEDEIKLKIPLNNNKNDCDIKNINNNNNNSSNNDNNNNNNNNNNNIDNTNENKNIDDNSDNENEKTDNITPLLNDDIVTTQYKDNKLANITNGSTIKDDNQSVKSFFVSTENIVQLNFRKSRDPVLDVEKFNEKKFSPKIPWTKKLIKYFDLDLFKDFTYINFMIGLTLTAFSEVNIALLTPFFLSDFGFTLKEITIIMSSLGVTDLIVRLSTSYISSKLTWSGPMFYICGVLTMVFARSIIALAPSFNIVLLMFIIMGAGKSWRTIFLNLVIASHIELNRLPAAQGLQLMTQGIFALACGPIVGLVRDATNYTVTIYILNIISIVPMMSWILEMLYRKYRTKAHSSIENKV